ncbi:MAG: translation elongation factor 4 [Candidatus Brocadiales bacterium]|nr:translation elongation factor 4 [Candidatus Bathyanammoxibius amoris]
MDTKQIRNFCIIAHIDHGKSTLADRLLEYTQTLSSRELREQVLDNMDLERERGITIKASTVTLTHMRDGREYVLNLIDTPGHVDFSYEVSRSLAACEGALLLVDASQGVEAQTVANTFLARDHNLKIIPAVNKTDLQQARPEEVIEEMEHTLDILPEEVIRVSAKTGSGVEDILEAIIERVPPPKGDSAGPLRALIFDSVYDGYRGVIVYVRIFDGSLTPGDKVYMMKKDRTFEVAEVGIFKPGMTATDKLGTGEVGYFVANIKTIQDVEVGDTITNSRERAHKPLPGYKKPLPMVYCGLYPTMDTDLVPLRAALEKLALNDSSFTFEPEQSLALGFGFRCGFLGLLHMEIVQERLERESNVNLIQTAPSVTYEILTRNGDVLTIDNPEKVPPTTEIAEFREPIVNINIIFPVEFMGAVMQLAKERHGKYKKTEYLSQKRVMLSYELPLVEMIFDLHDRLKSATRGYGTLDYTFTGYKPADLVKLDILVGGRKVDALSSVVHRGEAHSRGKKFVKKLRKEIPRHMFEVAIQAAVGSRVIARETITPLRKNVTAKCYGGDVTRKRKLLEKQKAGKKRMKNIGSVEIPQEAFLSVMATNNE